MSSSSTSRPWISTTPFVVTWCAREVIRSINCHWSFSSIISRLATSIRGLSSSDCLPILVVRPSDQLCILLVYFSHICPVDVHFLSSNAHFNSHLLGIAVRDTASLSFEWTLDDQHHLVQQPVFGYPVFIELPRCLLKELVPLNSHVLWIFNVNAERLLEE